MMFDFSLYQNQLYPETPQIGSSTDVSAANSSASCSLSVVSEVLLPEEVYRALSQASSDMLNQNVAPLMSSHRLIQSAPGIWHVVEEKPIGRGAFGTVYPVKSKVIIEQGVAKLYRADDVAKRQRLPQKLSRDPFSGKFLYDRAIKRVNKEVWAQRGHRVAVYGPLFFESQNEVWTIMPHCGPNLWTLLTSKTKTSLSFDDRVSIAVGICDQLELLSAQGVAHRDLKPENCCVKSTDRGFVVTFIDFGLVKRNLTRESRTPKGSLYYVAPEVVDGRNRVSEKSDIYSCAGIFIQLFWGKNVTKKKEDAVDSRDAPRVSMFETVKQPYLTDQVCQVIHIPEDVDGQLKKDMRVLFEAMQDANPDQRPDYQSIRRFFLAISHRRELSKQYFIEPKKQLARLVADYRSQGVELSFPKTMSAQLVSSSLYASLNQKIRMGECILLTGEFGKHADHAANLEVGKNYGDPFVSYKESYDLINEGLCALKRQLNRCVQLKSLEGFYQGLCELYQDFPEDSLFYLEACRIKDEVFMLMDRFVRQALEINFEDELFQEKSKEIQERLVCEQAKISALKKLKQKLVELKNRFELLTRQYEICGFRLVDVAFDKLLKAPLTVSDVREVEAPLLYRPWIKEVRAALEIVSNSSCLLDLFVPIENRIKQADSFIEAMKVQETQFKEVSNQYEELVINMSSLKQLFIDLNFDCLNSRVTPNLPELCRSMLARQQQLQKQLSSLFSENETEFFVMLKEIGVKDDLVMLSDSSFVMKEINKKVQTFSDELKRFQCLHLLMCEQVREFRNTNSSGIREMQEVINHELSALFTVSRFQTIALQKVGGGVRNSYSRSHFFGQGRAIKVDQLYASFACLRVVNGVPVGLFESTRGSQIQSSTSDVESAVALTRH